MMAKLRFPPEPDTAALIVSYLCIMKHLLRLVLLLALLSPVVSFQGCKAKGPYNPYLKLKNKDKPGTKARAADKKHIKKGNKAYKKQLGNNRKHLFGRRKPS
jgi:hypothetical protein